jgi:hypothetical protein
MLDANLIQPFVQLHDLELCLEIDLIVEAGGQSIPCGLTILRHHDDRRLQRGQHGKNQVEEDIGVWIECLVILCQNDGIEKGPCDQDAKKQDYERPGSTERRDAVGEAIADGLLFLEGVIDVLADMISFGDASDQPALTLG